MHRRDFLKLCAAFGLSACLPNVQKGQISPYLNIVLDPGKKHFRQRIEEYKDTMQGNLVSVLAQQELSKSNDYNYSKPVHKQECIDKLLRNRPKFIIDRLDRYSDIRDSFAVLCRGNYAQGAKSDMYQFRKMFQDIRWTPYGKPSENLSYSEVRRQAYVQAAHCYAKYMADGLLNIGYLEANIHTLNFAISSGMNISSLAHASRKGKHDGLYRFFMHVLGKQYSSSCFEIYSQADCMLLGYVEELTRETLPRKDADVYNTLQEIKRQKLMKCRDMNSPHQV